MFFGDVVKLGRTVMQVIQNFRDNGSIKGSVSFNPKFGLPEKKRFKTVIGIFLF